VTNQSNDCRFQYTFHHERHNVCKQLDGSVILGIYNARKCEVERKTCNPV